MTKIGNGFLGVPLAFALGGFSGWGQTASTPATALNAVQSASKAYRLTWTITDVDGGKRIGTQHFAMVVVSGTKTEVKLGSRVPIATGSANAASPLVQRQFTYLDVGLNIEAYVDEVANGMKLRSKVEQSGVVEDKSSADLHEPVIRQTRMEGTSLVMLGKPLTLGSLDVPGGTRHLDIEVLMEAAR